MLGVLPSGVRVWLGSGWGDAKEVVPGIRGMEFRSYN